MTYPPQPPAPSADMPPVGPPMKPNNYLAWSILTTILCCLPFGIVAIVNSTKVDSFYLAGQYAAAADAAAKAKRWNIISMICAAVAAVSYLLFWLLVLSASQS